MMEFRAETEQWLSTLHADKMGIFFNLPDDYSTAGVKSHWDKEKIL